MLESKDNHIIDYGSTKANNKNIIRAVYTKNHKLLEECLAKENFFSTFFDRWSVDTNFNAFDLALKQGDKKAIQLLCDIVKNKNFKYARQQRSSLSTFDTGSNSIHAYGTHVRRVQMGRGGKELNAALTKDDRHTYPFDHDTIATIFQTVTDMSIMDILRANIDNFEWQIQNSIETILLAGNFNLAGEIVKKLRKQQSPGFSEAHELALTAKGSEDFKDIKSTSCTAKTISSSITPIHFACINPNGKILEALLAKNPEYSISDFGQRKPVHYAAACESTEPLAFLLKKGVDYREGSRNKQTPLMIAAQCGRTKNVELLLKQGDETILTHATRDRMNAFHFAVEKGHLDVVKLLVKYKADIEYPGR